MARMTQKKFQFTDDQIALFKRLGKNAAQWVRVAVDEKAQRENEKQICGFSCTKACTNSPDCQQRTNQSKAP